MMMMRHRCTRASTEAARLEQLLAAMRCVLEHMPGAWPAVEFEARSLADPALKATYAALFDDAPDEARYALPAALEAELQAALRVAAASVTACKAMHDMVSTLRDAVVIYHTREERETMARELVRWCRIGDPTTALNGRVDDGLCGADAWRAFARSFAETVAMPCRIRLARSETARHRAMQLLMQICGRPPPRPLRNGAELNRLAVQDDEQWQQQALDMLQLTSA